MGLAEALAEVLWTRNFLCEQGYDVKEANVYQDNKSIADYFTKPLQGELFNKFVDYIMSSVDVGNVEDLECRSPSKECVEPMIGVGHSVEYAVITTLKPTSEL